MLTSSPKTICHACRTFGSGMRCSTGFSSNFWTAYRRNKHSLRKVCLLRFGTCIHRSHPPSLLSCSITIGIARSISVAYRRYSEQFESTFETNKDLRVEGWWTCPKERSWVLLFLFPFSAWLSLCSLLVSEVCLSSLLSATLSLLLLLVASVLFLPSLHLHWK